ncbi:MAG: threonine synthase [Thermoflavifilum sp.]|nr:threonine synthase [Thermoflavifilum sp.]
MKLYSTKNPKYIVDFETALFQSLPPDNGLYMPCAFPVLSRQEWQELITCSFPEIAFRMAHAFLHEEVESQHLRKIVEEAFCFPIPLVQLDEQRFVLELFHGPSLAFKDIGARFMSRLMAYFLEKRQREIHILVATSGDTGGAVALGFHRVPGIKVTILFPSGKVSALQEKQLTTLNENIHTLEIEGSFDDCQHLVKQAFLDQELNQRFILASANSINIARLIPQSFYYVYAWAQLRRQGIEEPPIFSVPSGNFGNLTAGIFAQRMGMPVQAFVASTNVNDEVPCYLRTGHFQPRPSIPTLSNAMDVGNPSNFQRLSALFGHDVQQMRRWVYGYAFDDRQTLAEIRRVAETEQYVLCPHTAVASLGLRAYFHEHPSTSPGIFLATAHPGKFATVYPEDIRSLPYWPAIPDAVSQIVQQPSRAIRMKNDFAIFKSYLLQST